ncbi:MAG TPA: diacylglycerol kinase family protein [Actinomycetales bacterium]|nr:diacylglycerol kinase family protein [Actinomycetales bacterium]
MTAPVLVVVLAVVVAVLVSLAAVVLLRRGGRPGEASDGEHAQTGRRRLAVVVNPTKFSDVAAARRQVTSTCTALGWDAPLWLETTAADPGGGQTREALAAGVDLVCALGGDGTVRTVAENVVRTGVPLGLLPQGTGNLLARNLGLPLDDLDAALRVALTGADRTVDVGRVVFDSSGEDQSPVERVFLVMAGLGFDAAMMAGVTEQLKARVGWLAYVFSGVTNLTGERAKVWMSADDGPEITRRVRTVIVGNCGRLTGGIVLIPDAEVDDGWLDVVALSPRGVVSWASMATRVLSRREHHRIGRRRCREVRVRCDPPQQGQLDGDPVGMVRALRARIDPKALVLRVPQ